jgi:hypothetical protein
MLIEGTVVIIWRDEILVAVHCCRTQPCKLTYHVCVRDAWGHGRRRSEAYGGQKVGCRVDIHACGGDWFGAAEMW